MTAKIDHRLKDALDRLELSPKVREALETIHLELKGAYEARLYQLLSVIGYEARVVEAHLEYKSFPKGRREIAEAQVRRMRAASKDMNDIDALYAKHPLLRYDPRRKGDRG